MTVTVPDDLDADDPSEITAAAASERGPDAAYAVNWRTVLLIDGAMGAAVAVAGLILAIVWNPVGGALMGVLGLVYVLLVVRRGREWARWRRRAGL